MKKTKLPLLLSIIVFYMVSCSQSSISDDVLIMQQSRIEIPFTQMERKICFMFEDSLGNDDKFKIVHYLDEKSCTACEINKISNWEKIKRLKLMITTKVQ